MFKFDGKGKKSLRLLQHILFDLVSKRRWIIKIGLNIGILVSAISFTDSRTVMFCHLNKQLFKIELHYKGHWLLRPQGFGMSRGLEIRSNVCF